MSLVNIVSRIRPIPILPQPPSLVDLRQAVIDTYKLHIKWTVRHEAAPKRVRTLPTCVNDAETRDSRLRSSWVFMLDDGIHVMVSDVDDHIKLRRLDTGQVVWKSYLDISSICCLDYTLYEGDIIVIYNVYSDEYVCLSNSTYFY